jgi:aryl-alcohol dehydrogenase-like predicted oxidoreductase
LLNERLVAKAISGNRGRYIVATKFGFEIDDAEQLTWRINGAPDYVRKSVERSLRNLGTDYIDLYYLHRVDANTPIEETVDAMATLVKEGKVRYIGLSEVSTETARRAHAVHPLTAVQSEYSLFERTAEADGTITALRDMGIGFVAYSPLGRGFLSGAITKEEDIPADDFRRAMPRFQGAFFQRNLDLVAAIREMAADKGITPSQLALAWTVAKGVVAIPGTKRPRYVEENIAAAAITLSAEDLQRLESIVPLGTDTGDRYDATGMAMVNA